MDNSSIVLPLGPGPVIPPPDTVIPLVGIQKRISEYALPATVQTHEVAPIGHSLLLITQQERNSIVKVKLDPSSGSPVAASKFTLENSSYRGAHGLRASTAYPGLAWVTLQFASSILLVDPVNDDPLTAPTVVKKFQLPKPLRGPHVVLEDGADLWVTCKDSGHVVRLSHETGTVVASYPCSRRPIFVAVASGYVYASLDERSRIFCLELESGKTREIEIPSDVGSTPVGLITGPDGNVWFVLLGDSNGGTGTFGRITAGSSKITWFQLAIAKKAGLLHLAFDITADPNAGFKLWLLGSSIGSQLNADAVYTVHLQPDHLSDEVRVAAEEAMMLPTQASLAHRVLQHRSGLFVTELGVSTLAHIAGTAVQGPARDDQAADAYALWGLGALRDSVVYPIATSTAFPVLEDLSQSNKRKRSAAYR